MFNDSQKNDKDMKRLNHEVEQLEGEVEKIDEKIGLKTEKVAEKSAQKIEKVDQKVEDVKTDVKEIKSDVRDLSRATKTLFKIFTRSHDYLLNHYIWYYNWHTNKASSPTHWAALLLTLAILVYIFGFQLGFFGGAKPVIYAGAGINKMINYQGKLTDNSDIPVADGNYDMIFSIYDVAAGGTPLWTCNDTVDVPTVESVAVANGIFSVGLGVAAAGGDCDNALTLDFNTDEYYLGVTVGLDLEMAPRKRLGAAGYAYNADAVDGIHASSTATANQLLALTASSQISGITELILADGATRYINVDDAVADTGDNLEVYAGNADQESLLDLNGGDLLLYGGSGVNAGTPGNMILSYAGGGPRGQVYVGTNTGSEMLTVGGNVAAADLTLTGGDLFASTATTFNVFNTVATTINAFGAAAIIGLGAASGTITLGSNSTINGGSADNDDITIQGTSSATRTTSYVNLQPTAGNVGIGTTSPSSQLEVANSSGGQIELTDAGSGQRYSLLLQAPTSAQQYGQILSWKYGTGVGAKDLVLQGSGGKVGIGDTTPDGLLDVEPTGAVTTAAGATALTVSNLTTNSTTSLTKYGAYITSTGAFTGGTSYNYGLYVDTVSGADYNYSAYFAGTVGIGGAPSKDLQVTRSRQNDATWLLIENTGASGGGITHADTILELKSTNIDAEADWVMLTGAGHISAVDSLIFRNQAGAGTTTMIMTYNGKVGVGRGPDATTGNAFEVEGTASKTAAGDWLANSDLRIKTDIQSVDDAISTIKELKPVKFKYTDWYMSQHPSIKDQYYYNYVAQDFSKVFPDSVKGSGEYLPDGSEILQLDPHNASVVAVSAIQEQQKQIEDLQQGLSLIQGELDGNLKVDNLEVKDKIITQDIEIKGHIIGSHDTRGVITIPTGKTEAEFVFDTPYLFEPSVVATQKITCADSGGGKICGVMVNGGYAVEVYQDKFIVHIKQNYNNDIIFSWQAQQ